MKNILKKSGIIFLLISCILMAASCTSEPVASQNPTATEPENIPNIDIPNIDIPDIDIPDISIPDTKIPDTIIPDEIITYDNNSAKESIEKQVLVDRDGIKITATKYVTDSFYGEGISLEVENNRKEDIFIGYDDMTVNGFMVTDLFFCEVPAGKKETEVLYLDSENFREIGIENLGKIEVDFYASNNDTYESIFEGEHAVIYTSVADKMETEIDTEGIELYNDNDIKVILIDIKETYFGTNLVVYVENNNSSRITISDYVLKLNGIEVTSLFLSTVMPGKKEVTEIMIFDSELEENNIESVDEIEMSFTIYDLDKFYEEIDAVGPIIITKD